MRLELVTRLSKANCPYSSRECLSWSIWISVQICLSWSLKSLFNESQQIWTLLITDDISHNSTKFSIRSRSKNFPALPTGLENIQIDPNKHSQPSDIYNSHKIDREERKNFHVRTFFGTWNARLRPKISRRFREYIGKQVSFFLPSLSGHLTRWLCV